MSRTYDNEKKPSQSTFSFKPTASFLQTRPFAPIQTDLDEDATPRPSGYTENFLEKIINQSNTEASDTSVQPKRMNRVQTLRAKRMSMIQAKLNIGEPNDKYEQEADATASKVVQQINSSTQDQSVQKQEAMEEEEELQMKPIPSIQREEMEEEEELQMKSLVQRRENFGGGEASTDLESSIQSARSSGQPLDASLQAKMGQAMGADFSGVKVHTDSQSDQLNKSIQAKAFTTGQDVFFRQGAYEPSSRGGQELIAHELTHVVQQNNDTVQRSTHQEVNTIINNTSKFDTNESEVIQRRVGFEVETGIPITERVDDPARLNNINNPEEWHGCYPDDMGKTVRYSQMIISADNHPPHTPTPTEPFNQWSIIEMVTDPIDDSMPIGNFEAIARDWISKLVALKGRAQNTPPAQKITGTPYYVGLPSPQAYNSWDRIAPQVTIGLPLDQVSKVITAFPRGGTASQDEATKEAQRAPSVATAIMKDLIGFIQPSSTSGVNDLKGLVTLMCNYLLVGSNPYCAKMIYMKNRPANIFYKSKLSAVRNNLEGVGGSYAKTVFAHGSGIIALKTLLLSHTRRTQDQPLFIADTITNQGAASTVTVGTWLNEVLNGIDDQILDEMKNPWSDDIDPDANNEVVIELRKIGYNIQHNNFVLDDDNGLLAYLKKVYLANKAIKLHQD
jgi:hypothetical protein